MQKIKKRLSFLFIIFFVYNIFTFANNKNIPFNPDVSFKNVYTIKKVDNIEFIFPIKNFFYYLELTGYKLKAKINEIERLNIKGILRTDYFKNKIDKMIIYKSIYKDKYYYDYVYREYREINFNNIKCYLGISGFSKYQYHFEDNRNYVKTKKNKTISFIYTIIRQNDLYPLFYFRIYFDLKKNRISYEIMEILNNEEINCYVLENSNNKQKVTNGIIKTRINKINFSYYNIFDIISCINYDQIHKIENIMVYDWTMLNLPFFLKIFINSFSMSLKVKEIKFKFNNNLYSCYDLTLIGKVLFFINKFNFIIDKKRKILLKLTSTNKYQPELILVGEY